MTVLLEYGTKRRKRMQKLMFENVKKCGPCNIQVNIFWGGGRNFYNSHLSVTLWNNCSDSIS